MQRSRSLLPFSNRHFREDLPVLLAIPHHLICDRMNCLGCASQNTLHPYTHTHNETAHTHNLRSNHFTKRELFKFSNGPIQLASVSLPSRVGPGVPRRPNRFLQLNSRTRKMNPEIAHIAETAERCPSRTERNRRGRCILCRGTLRLPN